MIYNYDPFWISIGVVLYLYFFIKVVMDMDIDDWIDMGDL